MGVASMPQEAPPFGVRPAPSIGARRTFRRLPAKFDKTHVVTKLCDCNRLVRVAFSADSRQRMERAMQDRMQTGTGIGGKAKAVDSHASEFLTFRLGQES